MSNRRRSLVRSAVIIIVVLAVAVGAAGQRQKVAVFVQAAAPVPTADLEVMKNYAAQQCSVIAGASVCTQGELMYAQRMTNSYIGHSLTVEGMQRLAQTLLMLSSRIGSTLPFTRQEIADMAGTTTETAIRVMSRLKDRRIIRSVRGKVIILDKEKLRLLSEGPPRV